jgi:hypothetical protein
VAGAGFIIGAISSVQLLSSGTLFSAWVYSVGLVLVVLPAIAVYTSLRRWRRRSRTQHYITWILCVAAAAIPSGIVFRLLLEHRAPPDSQTSYGGGPLLDTIAIVLMGIVLGVVAESLDGAVARAKKEISPGRDS